MLSTVALNGAECFLNSMIQTPMMQAILQSTMNRTPLLIIDIPMRFSQWNR
jgi:hypothetical protein